MDISRNVEIVENILQPSGQPAGWLQTAFRTFTPIDKAEKEPYIYKGSIVSPMYSQNENQEVGTLKKRIFSAVLALFLCISSHSAAYAWQEDVLTEASGSAARDSTVPTPAEAYAAMIALKDQDGYREGTAWTDYEPYSDTNGYYHWQGGLLDGKRISAVGCVAFAFILSDTAFGQLPARMYGAGEFTYKDIKAGDILRINSDAHTMIVLEVSDAGIIVAEGNVSTGDHKGKVHWGRSISKEEVMRTASHYITRYPQGYIPPTDPEAGVPVASGNLDGGLSWNLTKAGTLTVSGTGAMPDFDSAEQQPWKANSSQIRKIVIADGVTRIGGCAFWNCGALGVEIPSSVAEIGSSAFRKSSIVSVTVPSGVKTIGDSAFRECENLSSVTVSEGVETIVQNAFRACKSLSSIALPASIEEVGASAFFQCTAMTSAAFAPGSKRVRLGENLFTQCYYLMRVTLPKSVDCISNGMFQNCLMLPGVIIPQGAESIGTGAFASCSAFTAVVIPDSVETIEMAAFASCPLENIYFTGTKEQWNSIGKSADTMQVVSKAQIHYNYVPSPAPDPDEGDDNDNNNGDNPGSVGNGGGNPGSGGGQQSEQIPFAKGKTFTVGQFTYKVTKAGAEAELTTSKSTASKVTIQTVTGTDGVKYKITSIGAKAMQNNRQLTSLTIGADVKKIGKSAFNGCRKLGKVKIKSKKLSSVGKQVFKGTKSGMKVKVPSKQLKKYRKMLKKAGIKVKQVTK